jgi:membrane protein implicated in regulation of membrane protease activity
MALVTAILLAVFVLPRHWGILAVVIGVFVEGAESWFWIRWSQRRRAAVGAEALVGATAKVVSECMPVGQVRVRGELWRARCETGAAAGEEVRVVAVDGLTLLVEPL